MIDLNWFGWVLVGMYVLSALLSVGTVGKPRTPTEPGAAVIIVVLNTLLVLGLLFVGTQQ